MGYCRKRRMSYTHTPAGWCGGILNNTRWERVSNTGGCRIILRDQRYWNGRGDRGVDGDLSPSAGGLIPGGVPVLKNTRGVVAQTGGEPAVSRMIPGGIASHPIPGRVVRTLSGKLAVPGMMTGGVASKRQFCLYQVTVSVYIRGVFSHTSGLAVASALMACRLLPSSCDGVYVAGVGTGMVASPPSGQSLQYPGLWVAWTDDQGQ